MGHKRVTIQDIADEANVSISTVSRVLNETAPVRESKRVAVLAAIERLDYRPNTFAQGLAGGQSFTIGVLTQEISSPFYDAILHGTLNGLRGSGYSPLIADGHRHTEQEQKAISTLFSRQVDGLIIIHPMNESEYLQEISAERPIVVFGRAIPSMYTIIINDFEGGYNATKHLIDLGHRKIAHIAGIMSHSDSVERLNGYEQALRDAGLSVHESLIVEGQFTEQSGVMAVEMLLTRGLTFSALFAGNDQMAYGARLALHRHGLRVPEDVSIIGYDDQHGSAYTIPPLTTMHQPAAVIGKMAATSLLRLLKGEELQPVQLSAELIIRESTSRVH